MVLVSSNKFQEAKAKLALLGRKIGSVNGAERTDDELLSDCDNLVQDIYALLVPSTDER